MEAFHEPRSSEREFAHFLEEDQSRLTSAATKHSSWSRCASNVGGSRLPMNLKIVLLETNDLGNLSMDSNDE